MSKGRSVLLTSLHGPEGGGSSKGEEGGDGSSEEGGDGNSEEGRGGGRGWEQ